MRHLKEYFSSVGLLAPPSQLLLFCLKPQEAGGDLSPPGAPPNHPSSTQQQQERAKPIPCSAPAPAPPRSPCASPPAPIG